MAFAQTARPRRRPSNHPTIPIDGTGMAIANPPNRDFPPEKKKKGPDRS
jgi:hypothetical protein